MKYSQPGSRSGTAASVLTLTLLFSLTVFTACTKGSDSASRDAASSENYKRGKELSLNSTSGNQNDGSGFGSIDKPTVNNIPTYRAFHRVQVDPETMEILDLEHNFLTEGSHRPIEPITRGASRSGRYGGAIVQKIKKPKDWKEKP